MPWNRPLRKLASEMKTKMKSVVLPVGPPKTVSTWTRLTTYMVHLPPSVRMYWICTIPRHFNPVAALWLLPVDHFDSMSFPFHFFIHSLGPSKMLPPPFKSLSCSPQGKSGVSLKQGKNKTKQKQPLKSPNWISTLIYFKICAVMYSVMYGNFFQVLTIHHSVPRNF